VTQRHVALREGPSKRRQANEPAPLVDVDMGVGREYGYRDPRLGDIRVYGHGAAAPVTDRLETGAVMLRVRRAAGASRKAVARVLGESAWAIRDWEKGRLPQPTGVRARWADACATAARTGQAREILGRS
jgi:hypothetical protein